MATLNSSNITDGNIIEPTDILQLYDAFKSGGGTTGAYNVSISGSITGSLLGTASLATTSSFVNTLNQSVIISGSILVNTSNQTMGQFVGAQNGYVEFSLRNTSTGNSASGDFAVYADTGTVLNNYIDMGINNSGLDPAYFYGGTDFGNALDAYVYNVGGNLRIGNATSQAPYSQSFYLFSNPTATPNITITGSQVAISKTGSLNGVFDISGSTYITGSLNVSRGITGSLLGTSSFAVSSSRAISSSIATTASYVAQISDQGYSNAGGSLTSANFKFYAGTVTITSGAGVTGTLTGLAGKTLGTNVWATATLVGDTANSGSIYVRTLSVGGVLEFTTLNVPNNTIAHYHVIYS